MSYEGAIQTLYAVVVGLGIIIVFAVFYLWSEWHMRKQGDPVE
jgi:hypothetical protein